MWTSMWSYVRVSNPHAWGLRIGVLCGLWHGGLQLCSSTISHEHPPPKTRKKQHTIRIDARRRGRVVQWKPQGEMVEIKKPKTMVNK